MWNRYQIGRSGFLTALALCGALSISACSDDDDDVSDGAVGDSSADARGDAARADARSDAEAGSGDARVADVSADVSAEGGADAGSEAARADADAAVTDTGRDVVAEAAADAGADVRVDAPVLDTGSDVRVDTGVTADAGSDARDTGVDAGVDAGSDTGVIAVDAGTEAAATVDAGSDAADAGSDAGGPTLRYDFETGDDGWTPDNSGVAVSSSAAIPGNTGTHTLLVAMTGTATHEITVFTADGYENGVFQFSIFVPATSSLTLLKAFNEIADEPTTRPEVILPFTDEADRGVWRTYTVTLPTTTVTEAGLVQRGEIEQIGLQFEGTGAFYIDTVRY